MRRPQRRPRLGRVLLCLLVATTAAACGSKSESPSASTVTDDHANLVVIVSNQSLKDHDVGIKVKLDGKKLIDDDFEVEGQHKFVSFPLDVPDGPHVLAAEAHGAKHQLKVDVPAGQRRWAVLLFWSSDTEKPHFTGEVSQSEPGFQ